MKEDNILKKLSWELRLSFIRDVQLTAKDIQKRINYMDWQDGKGMNNLEA